MWRVDTRDGRDSQYPPAMAAGVAGCGLWSTEPPESDPTIVGTITELGTNRILIEETPGVWGRPEVAGDKMYLTVAAVTTRPLERRFE